MSYIVNQDIIDRVGNAKAAQLTTDSGSTPDSAVLDEVRKSSEGEADSYLARRYATPVDLTAHPELAATLKGFVLDIAVYRLHGRRAPVSEAHEKARDQAIEWLKQLAEGKIVLPAASTPSSTNADDPLSAWGSKEQNLSTMRDEL